MVSAWVITTAVSPSAISVVVQVWHSPLGEITTSGGWARRCGPFTLSARNLSLPELTAVTIESPYVAAANVGAAAAVIAIAR